MNRSFIPALIVAVAAQPIQACGPRFSETILDMSYAILRAPVTSFDLEISRIKLDLDSLPGNLEVPAEVSNHTTYVRNWLDDDEHAAAFFALSGDDLIADKDGCRTALFETHSDLARDVAEVAMFLKDGSDVENYRSLRAVMLGPDDVVREYLELVDIQTADRILQTRDWPDFLPEEFHLYLEGAVEFSALNWDAAAASFEKLLALPLEQRKYRSTWAAYMRGRVELKKGDPDMSRSVVHFQRTLDAREDGCSDVLHLGWDALRCVSDFAELSGDFNKSIRYRVALAYKGRGPVSPMRQLKSKARRWLNDGTATKISKDDPFARQVFTATAMNATHEVRYWEDEPAISNEWIGFLTGVDLTPAESAQAAQFAYRLGNLDLAETWLRKAPKTDHQAFWLQSKLNAKKGQVRTAVRQIGKAESGFPRSLKSEIPQYDHYGEWEYGADQDEFRDYQNTQYWGERGVLHMANDDYEGALDAFLRSGHWRDAAYVAEQLLSREELLTFVRDRWPTEESAGGMQTPYSIRYLTARRLARDHYFKDARGLFPNTLIPVFDKYVEHYRVFRNEARSEQERAEAGWEAAQLHRRLGMELFGTEVAPDFTCWQGNYGGRSRLLGRVSTSDQDRVAKKVNHYRNPVQPAPRVMGDWEKERLAEQLAEPVFPQPTPSEKWRYRHYAQLPNMYRFHYRHVAADLAWEVSKLMPNESEDTAKVLNIAGSWISTRYPKQADIFYKSMIRRNWSTPTARMADHFRWFPGTTWREDYRPWKSLWQAPPEDLYFVPVKEADKDH